MFTSHLRVQLSSVNFCRIEKDELKHRTPREHTENLPSEREHPKHLSLSVLLHPHRQNQHILFVLFSSEVCTVCDTLKRHPTPAQHASCLFCRVYVWQLPRVTPTAEFPVGSQSSVTFWIVVTTDVVCLVVEC